MVIKLSEIQEFFPSINKRNVHVIIHDYTKKGKVPKWLIKAPNKKGYQIKVKEFEQWLTLDERIKEYGSNKLYWIFLAMGFNDFSLSKFFSEKSKHFKNSTSWYLFFTHNLFARSDAQSRRSLYEPTRSTEFVRIGTRYIYDLLKSGKFEIKNKEIFG